MEKNIKQNQDINQQQYEIEAKKIQMQERHNELLKKFSNICPEYAKIASEEVEIIKHVEPELTYDLLIQRAHLLHPGKRSDMINMMISQGGVVPKGLFDDLPPSELENLFSTERGYNNENVKEEIFIPQLLTESYDKAQNYRYFVYDNNEQKRLLRVSEIRAFNHINYRAENGKAYYYDHDRKTLIAMSLDMFIAKECENPQELHEKLLAESKQNIPTTDEQLAEARIKQEALGNKEDFFDFIKKYNEQIRERPIKCPEKKVESVKKETSDTPSANHIRVEASARLQQRRRQDRSCCLTF